MAVALPWLKTREDHSLQRKDPLQCSAKNSPWGGFGEQPDMEQQQGGRRSVSFTSAGWVSCSLVPCYRQGSCTCRKCLTAPSAIGAGMLLAP